METPLWMWIFFVTLILLLLAFDLGFFNKKHEVIPLKKSILLSGIYFLIALLYGFFINFQLGSHASLEYMTGFFIEKSLSLDNIFVISLILSYFKIPQIHQHAVLFWGILGVIILRGVMISLGVMLIHKFAWVMLFFGGFLILTGAKILFIKEKKRDFNENIFFKLIQKTLPITSTFQGGKFWIKEKGLWKATPLFTSLLMIEGVDIVFAVDSIPAIFAITRDPYIIYTSNIFAILGLRSLYFALHHMLHRFTYLQHALALILICVGAKIFYSEWVGKIHPIFSLSVTLSLLFGGIFYSLLKSPQIKKN